METTAQEETENAAEPQQKEAPPTEEHGTRKERVGIVTSDKMDKSIVVAVQRQVKHDMYGKFMKRTTKIMAHDEDNDAEEGDTVSIMESRPYSKRKRWRLTEIIERAE